MSGLKPGLAMTREFFSPVKTEVFGGCWCREGFWIDGMCPPHIYEPAVR